jgi:acyl-CoA synthetase (AMP-forming)/AMP-acid ligase II
MPNFAFQFLARRVPQRVRPQLRLHSLRALVNCSEPVRAESMREFYDAFSANGLRRSVLHSCYAMAENVFAVTHTDLLSATGPRRIWADGTLFRREQRIALVAEGTPGATSWVSSGRPLPGTQLHIAGEDGKVLPEGCLGEIRIQSDCLFDGYYNHPELTAAAMQQGWYRTGDLGFCLDGELYVAGRKKDMLIVAGENLYPQDIEEIVCAHAEIHDGRAIALGILNPALGTEEIVVVAELESAELAAESARIEQEIRAAVASGMGVSVRTVFLKPPKWIVKSTAGKASRSATREKLLGEHPELNPDVQGV